MPTEQEHAATKSRIRSLTLAGIAAFVGAYIFRAGLGGLPSFTPVIFMIAGALCFVMAGIVARKLNQEMK